VVSDCDDLVSLEALLLTDLNILLLLLILAHLIFFFSLFTLLWGFGAGRGGGAAQATAVVCGQCGELGKGVAVL
jgi:hypothetical protein